MGLDRAGAAPTAQTTGDSERGLHQSVVLGCCCTGLGLAGRRSDFSNSLPALSSAPDPPAQQNLPRASCSEEAAASHSKVHYTKHARPLRLR
jgi:hypothetical protein